MKAKDLRLKRALRTALLVLLLSAAGMGKMYAYDFSAVCETGQSLHYEITNATDFYVNTVREDRNLEVNFDGGSTIADPPTQTHWTYNADATYCMTLTGVLYLDGESMQNNPRSEYLEIGAFCGYECRGSCLATFNPAPFAQGYFYQMMLYSDVQSDETITFRIWDHEANAYLDVICTSNITFVADDGLGNLMFPYALTFTTNGGTTPTSFTISATTEPAEGGVVSGAGTYTVGDDCTLLASANFGYSFVNWTEDGQVISSDAEYTFMVTGDRNLIAKFSSNNAIVFVDDNVKAICIANWDTNGDGELSYAEAAAVTDLGQVFRENTEITSFEELQYFIGLTTISSYAFYNCTGLTSIVLPTSLETIGNSAFNDCTGLTGSLIIPNSVTTIGNYAFQLCRGFAGSLIIGNSVTSIGTYAFNYCSGFSQVLYNAINCVDVFNNTRPFFGCGGALTIGDNVERIPAYMFQDSGFTGDLVISNSVTTIGNDAFLGCSGFTSVYYTGNIDQWCGISFGNSYSNPLLYAHNLYVNNELVTNLVIPETVTEVKPYAFWGATCFTSLTISNSVASIGDNAFVYCAGLTGSLIIPNSVTTIGYSAFSNCGGFTGSLTLGNSMTEIGNYAFQGCSFYSITSLVETPPVCGEYTFSSVSSDFSVYVPCGFEEAYSSLSWGGFSNFIGLCESGTITVLATPEEGGTVTGNGSFEAGQTCTVIATANEGYALVRWTQNGITVSTDSEYTFYVVGDMVLIAHFASVDNIIFADANVKSICVSHWDINGDGELSYAEAASVTSLRDYFKYNSVITSFDELEYFIGLRSIESSAFNSCRSLTSITLPHSVTTIGNSAFAGCYGLTGNLIIPNSVTTIGNRAFSNCSGLTCDLVIPGSVTSIGDYAFYNCNGLTGDLVIPDSVTSIGDGAFEDCTGFTGLVLSNSLTRIGSNTFSNCSGFTGTLTIPNSVTSIGQSAFSGCSGFTGELIIPNSVTSIDGEEHSNAFEFCSGFTSLVLSNSLTRIGGHAFIGCSGLTGDLVIPNSVTSIGEGAFEECTGFTGKLIIPNSVNSIENEAFRYCEELTEVIMLRVTPSTLGRDVFETFIEDEEMTGYPIYVPYESLNDYKTATNWSNYESRIFPMAYTTIPGYGEGDGNYRFIASPLVENTAPIMVDNMITETPYDLYRFDQSEDAEWQNYKFLENTPNFFLTNGQGYLYANAEDVNVIFKGEFNEDETKEVELAYDADADFAGWNLVGNPFPVSAYANRSYYTMNEDGRAVEPNAVSSATAIPACTGVMVKADDQGETVVFNTTAPETVSNQGGLRIALSQVVDRGGVSTGSTTLQDKAIVSFNAGDRLEKFVFNKDNARISIPQDGKDLAIACAEKQGEMPLNFKATKNGTYTLSVDVENADVDYLHLIDNLTGADIDLLALRQAQGPAEYTFTAKITDYASRFRLVFSVCGDADGDNGTFAFINNGNIIVTGAEADAVLQIVDVTGRIIVCRDAARHVSTSGMTPGVYVLRLINCDNVKMQKIVIDR